MVKKTLFAATPFLFLSLWFIGTLNAHLQKDPWWEIIIHLASNGTYTLDEGKTSYSGEYTYAIEWSGCMEQDDEDFILYYEDSKLLRWDSQEKKKQPGTSRTKITKKFCEKPTFAFNYILTKKENIHFDFLIRGFRVPQMSRSCQYYLHFPASKENSYHPTDIAYNLHIYKGSNQIYFTKNDLLDETVKKYFHWSWKRYSPGCEKGNPSYLTHSYDVDVVITIHKHQKE